MDLRVYYRLRSGQQNKPGKKQLYIRLTVDGETASDYGSGVYIRPAIWDQSDQQAKGRSAEASEINERLSEIELQHRAILREFKTRYGRGEGVKPTAELIKAEFMTPGASDPDLLVFYPQFYSYQESLLGTDDEKAKKTMDRYRTAQKYLNEFVQYFCEKNNHRGRFSLRSITTAFGKQFHAWLQVNPETGKRRMQKDSANKYLSVLRDCLEYAIESSFLKDNPLDKFRPKRGKGKPVYFLDQNHIGKLLNLETDDEQLGYSLWWARFMCYTGLDYVDAIRYARNRTEYERQTEDGTVIYIQREKPPRNWCEIPVHPIVEVLFELYPAGPHDPILSDLNRHLNKVIKPLIGFVGLDSQGKPLKFTSKICRKTAGAIHLRMGMQMTYVSRLMGHSSIRTTEEHYANVTALSMQTEMKRLKSQSVNGSLIIAN